MSGSMWIVRDWESCSRTSGESQRELSPIYPIFISQAHKVLCTKCTPKLVC